MEMLTVRFKYDYGYPARKLVPGEQVEKLGEIYNKYSGQLYMINHNGKIAGGIPTYVFEKEQKAMDESIKFKVGDWVECVDDCGEKALTKGQKYLIIDTNMYNHIYLDDIPYAWDPTRFKHYSDPPRKPTGSSHYKEMVIDPRTFCEANGLSGNVMNIIKYVTRRKLGEDRLKDLEKARESLDFEIETEKRNRRIAAGEDARKVWGLT